MCIRDRSWVADFDYGGVRVLAMKPTTYMNLSLSLIHISCSV